MTTYTREERIAIRQFCAGMSERHAIDLTDAEQQPPAQVAKCDAVQRLSAHRAKVIADKAAKFGRTTRGE